MRIYSALIGVLFKDLIGCTFFSKKDLDNGYYKSSYTQENSGATFSRMMAKVLAPAIGKYAQFFINDVIRFSKGA